MAITSKLIISALALTASFTSAAKDFDYRVALEPSSSGTMYVDATIANKITAKFLLDTGSGLITINKATFEQLKKSEDVEYSHKVAARLANGKLHQVKMYRVSSFKIGDACDLGSVDLAVMPKGNNIVSINLLNRAAPFAMYTNPPTLALSGCQTSLVAQAQ